MPNPSSTALSDESFIGLTRGVVRFREHVSSQEQALCRQLVHDGQKPRALMISCAENRVIPELVTQSQPASSYLCQNLRDIVPLFTQANGGVSSAIGYAVLAYDGVYGRFVPTPEDDAPPVAVAPQFRSFIQTRCAAE